MREVTQALVDLCQELHSLPDDQRRVALLTLPPATLTAIDALRYEWYLWARPEQLAPEGNWRWWMMAGGRGGGKTRAASEQSIEWADLNPAKRMCLLGRAAGSVRRIMIRGMSGILRVSPPWFRPRWYKTDKMLVWPNDFQAELHSAEEPDTLRGPEYHFAWVTELFHYQIPRGEREPKAWREGIKLGLRLGEKPQGIIDSSPRATEFCSTLLLGAPDVRGDRPITQAQIDSGVWEIKHQLVDVNGIEHEYRVVVSRWSSERNAENLAPGVIAEWRHDLRGSALEQQELDGRILAKVAGVLFSHENFDANRVKGVPRIVRTLVAVDPTRSDSPTEEAGIVLGGLGENGHCYVWDDLSLRGTPAQWGSVAINALQLSGAEGIVREKNRMEQATKDVIRALDSKVKWLDVTATEGKRTRAEPVSALYEQGLVHHVRDARHPDKLARLEGEMVQWNPHDRNARSPNRMDAVVWLVTELKGLGAADGARHKPIRML